MPRPSAEQLEIGATDGGHLRGEYFAAPGDGPHPGVVVLHESFGLNDDIRRIAARFAGAGYAALAPDLYSHGTRLVCLSRVLVDMLSGGVAREIADIHAAREALAARVEVDAERVAVAGFCQGGGFALIAGVRPRLSRRGCQLRHGAGGPLAARRGVPGRSRLRRQGSCGRAQHGRAARAPPERARGAP
jgi:carboxymethylenebutenolidase